MDTGGAFESDADEAPPPGAEGFESDEASDKPPAEDNDGGGTELLDGDDDDDDDDTGGRGDDDTGGRGDDDTGGGAGDERSVASSSRSSWAASSSSSHADEHDDATEKKVERLTALKRIFDARDAALEPGLARFLDEYKQVGGDLQEAGRALMRSCIGFGACAALLRSWLHDMCGLTDSQIVLLEWEAASREVLRRIEARALDDALLLSDRYAERPPAWLERLGKTQRGRSLVAAITEAKPGSIAMSYSLRATAQTEPAALQQMLDDSCSLDMTRDEVLFEKALAFCISRGNLDLLKRLVTGSRRVEALGLLCYALLLHEGARPDWREVRQTLSLELCGRTDEALVRAALRPFVVTGRATREAFLAAVRRVCGATGDGSAALRDCVLLSEPLVLDALAADAPTDPEARKLLAWQATAGGQSSQLVAERTATAAALEWLVSLFVDKSTLLDDNLDLERVVAVAPVIAQVALAWGRQSGDDASKLAVARAVVAAQPRCRSRAVDLLLTLPDSRARDLALVDAALVSPLFVLESLPSPKPFFVFRLTERARPPFSDAFVRAAATLLAKLKSQLLDDLDRPDTPSKDKVNLRAFAKHVHQAAINLASTDADLKSKLSVLSKLASEFSLIHPTSKHQRTADNVARVAKKHRTT